MTEYYRLTDGETLEQLNSSPSGLSEQEAANRLKQHGENKLAERKKTPVILRFLKQLADPMIIILLAAAIVSLVLTLVNNADPNN